MKKFFLKNHKIAHLFMMIFSTLTALSGVLAVTAEGGVYGMSEGFALIVAIVLFMIGLIGSIALANLFRQRAIENKKVAKYYHELYSEGYSIDNPPDEDAGDLDGDGRGDDNLRRLGIIN